MLPEPESKLMDRNYLIKEWEQKSIFIKWSYAWMFLYIYSLIWALTTALSKSVAGERPFVYCTMSHTPQQGRKAPINRNAIRFLVMNTKSHYLIIFIMPVHAIFMVLKTVLV